MAEPDFDPNEGDDYDDNLAGYDFPACWDAGHILEQLDAACRNVSPAWTLDSALLSIAVHPTGPDRRPTRLGRDERDRVLQALVRTKATVPQLFEPYYPAALIGDGIDAAMGLVILWAETDAERAARGPNLIADAQDVVRILLNHCHCVRMRTRIKTRAEAKNRGAVLDRYFGAHLKRGAR